MVTLYEYMSQPHYWIAHDDEGYWLVPARNNGWSERNAFVGHVIALRQVTDLGGIDLGIPDEIALHVAQVAPGSSPDNAAPPN
jgi:glucose-6-phosphate 1-epimerase